MFGTLTGFDRLDEADLRIDGAIDAADPFFGGVSTAELERIEIELLADFVNDGLHCERGIRGPGSAIRRGLRLVDADVVTIDAAVGDVVAGENAHRAGADG